MRRRSPSSSTERSSRPRPGTAAWPPGSPGARRSKRKSPGRPTAGGWPTSRGGAGPTIFSCTTSSRAPRPGSPTSASTTRRRRSPPTGTRGRVSGRGGAHNPFLYDFVAGAEARLTNQPLNDATPKFSPDGKQVAFVRGGHELRVVDLESRKERVLATGVLDRQPFTSPRGFAWSPDGKWIAFLDTGAKGFTNAFLVPSAGGERRQVTFLANAFAGAVSWSPNGSFLLVNSGQRTEPGTLARVDLVPRTPRFREDQFRDLFIQESPRQPRTTPAPAPAPAEGSPPPADRKRTRLNSS